MEEFLRLQRVELLRQGVPESDSEDWESQHWPTEEEDVTDVEEDDGLEDADLTFITSILESFSRPKTIYEAQQIVLHKLSTTGRADTSRRQINDATKIQSQFDD